MGSKFAGIFVLSTWTSAILVLEVWEEDQGLVEVFFRYLKGYLVNLNVQGGLSYDDAMSE